MHNDFKFKKHDTIGATAAEDDSYLFSCFVDTGDLGYLQDINEIRRIVVGRTGAGKSALLAKLKSTCENIIELSPKSLSLNYITDNSIIKFYENAGVNLLPFYILLWKHIIVVELFRKKFKITNNDSYKQFKRILKRLTEKDKFKEIAIDYIEEWGDKFWLTSEERIKEITDKVETKLEGGLESKLPGLAANIRAGRTEAQEVTKTVQEIGKTVVSKVQIRELDNLITLLQEDIFADPQELYYITIDYLDEDWVDHSVKMQLIRALLHTVRNFRKVKNIKLIVALRQDLLSQVINTQVRSTFQDDKFSPYFLPLYWNKQELEELIEKRINNLIQRTYKKGNISWYELLPNQIDNQKTIDYILERTFNRPRDVICFINYCLQSAYNCSQLTATLIKNAEEHYSQDRLNALKYEWINQFPQIEFTVKLFYGVSQKLIVSEITQEFLSNQTLKVWDNINESVRDPVVEQLSKLFNPTCNFKSLRTLILKYFYTIGLIGIKTSGSSTLSWSIESTNPINTSIQINNNSIIYVHPMFYRALDIKHR